jgi:hypothetical protein
MSQFSSNGVRLRQVLAATLRAKPEVVTQLALQNKDPANAFCFGK